MNRFESIRKATSLPQSHRHTCVSRVQATTTLSKVALVIGNDEYGGDLGLTHAVSSAHAVAERLTVITPPKKP